MAFSPAFQADAGNKSKRRNQVWYQQNIMKVLESCKEKQVREIDTSIAMAKELLKFGRFVSALAAVHNWRRRKGILAVGFVSNISAKSRPCGYQATKSVRIYLQFVLLWEYPAIDTWVQRDRNHVHILDEPVAKHVEVPLRELVAAEDDSLMKPIEQEVLDLLYKSTEKGSGEKYFKARNKKAPEDKFLFRLTSNWDYGWQQKQSRVRARDVNRGRCAILRDTFYRKNNLAADPIHYAQPAGGEVGICSEYACYSN